MSTDDGEEVLVEEETESSGGDEPMLIETILKGDSEESAILADKLSRKADEANDLVDAIAEAMNIATDLHEVEKYTAEQVEKSEKAAEKALERIAPRIRVEQSRIHGRVMVASLQGDPHSFEKTLLLTMLKACGFTPIDAGSDLTPRQFGWKIKSESPDIVAVPVVTSEAAEQLKTTINSETRGSDAPSFIVYGRGSNNMKPNEKSDVAVEQDSLGAIGRIVEHLISRSQR